ncbi:MAG: DUF4340 domain-containing protein [Scytonema hyalinum WJT4-NPBG1]|jgi:hypothetical protein|nr:DUF4340 domain-containing protein [Scytonema hyalinum WJT4-NPBG1]
MKLQKTTLILILLALGLGGFVYFYEIKGTPQREEIKENKQQIFSFKEDDVQSLTVKTKNQTLNLERSGKSDGSKWEIKSPEIAPASNAIVGYLMNLLVEGKSERMISIPANELTEFSLDQPQATIDIKLKNQKTHQLILGKPDFNRRFMYAQADPPAKPDGNVNVLLVSTDFENAVNRELSEWKQLQPINDSVKPTPNADKPTPANSK